MSALSATALSLLADAGIALALLALMFAPLERSFPAARGQPLLRRHIGLDLAFFLGQQLVFGFAILAAVSRLQTVGAGTLPPAIRALFAAQPLVVRVIEVVMLGDLLVYWGHRLQHSWEPLWRFHAVHHSAESLDWLAAHREHPLDGLYTQTLMNLPMILSGFSLQAAAGVVVFRAVWAVFIHSNVRMPLGALQWLFGSPQLHHWHHERSRNTVNYGNLAPWTDLLFGTHACPDHEPPELGLEIPLPPSYLRMLLEPMSLRVPRKAPARTTHTTGTCNTSAPSHSPTSSTAQP